MVFAMYKLLNADTNNTGVEGVKEISKASWLKTMKTIYLCKNEIIEALIVWG